MTEIEGIRQQYSICLLWLAAELAGAEPELMIRVTASANFRRRAIHVSTRISTIIADLRPQVDAFAVRTTAQWRCLNLNGQLDCRKVEPTWEGWTEAPTVASCRDRAEFNAGDRLVYLGDLNHSMSMRQVTTRTSITRMWANAQRDGRPAEYRWRPLFNAAKFG